MNEESHDEFYDFREGFFNFLLIILHSRNNRAGMF